jgi:diaminohydroxyphosphoribosylaminopyrimidine deaminase/5-amino-6-(5-phosphoribosylamino)uracil reductase
MMTNESYMRQSLELAEKAKGYTAPNPMVGAVLVHEGRIIGKGWHHFRGSHHAEVNCLNSVAEGDRALIRESTMYVNLEPCAHQGLTPSCAVRLVKERVKKVVIANADPFEKVSGRGIAILEQGGIEVETGLLEAEGLWLNRRFFCFHDQKRPYVILKWAQTADGFIAPVDGSRLQISGEESMRLVHKWRTEESAIMVGATTARNDNPRLTARLWEGKQPLRIVLDRNLQLPETNHIFDEAAASWVVNEQRETLHGNLHSIKLPFDDSLLPALMERLHQAEMQSLIVEGGAHLLDCFIEQGLWDESRIFISPKILKEGIQAPLLNDEVAAMETRSGEDTLQFFVNANSTYQYVQGMEL